MAFINQIGKVLVSKYLEDANSDEVRTYSYIDLFNEGDVDKQLIDSFEQHFGFHIEDVWTSNRMLSIVILHLFKTIENSC